MISRISARGLWLSLFSVLSLWLAGCATTNSPATVDWDSRRGTYTYEQAVAELGAPRRSEPSSNNGRSAEWLTLRNAKTPTTQSIGTGYQAGGLDESIGQHVDLKPKDEYLRLTFDASGKLSQWSRIYR